MDHQPPTRTSASLLGRLRLGADNRAAWAEFVCRSGPLIRNGCRRWGRPDADSADLTQDVPLRLADQTRSFDDDPDRSFRSDVETVAHFPWCDLIELRTRAASRLTAVEGLSGAEAAVRTGMEVVTDFTARSKVPKMLREEVRRLEGGD